MELKFVVQLKRQKSLNEVFDAVYNPKKLSGYFTNASSGPLDEGRFVLWAFGEDPGKPTTVPVKVMQMEPNSFISFTWAVSEGVYDAKSG